MDRIELAFNRFKQRLGIYGLKIDKPIEWFILFGKKTQAQMVLWHLQTFGKITRLQATEIYGIGYPPTPIKELRDMFQEKKAPYIIENVTIEGINRWGKETRFDEYTLKEVNNDRN